MSTAYVKTLLSSNQLQINIENKCREHSFETGRPSLFIKLWIFWPPKQTSKTRFYKLPAARFSQKNLIFFLQKLKNTKLFKTSINNTIKCLVSLQILCYTKHFKIYFKPGLQLASLRMQSMYKQVKPRFTTTSRAKKPTEKNRFSDQTWLNLKLLN